MNHFQDYPAFYNQPIRLSAEEKAKPLEVLREFFEICHLSEPRQLLWNMVETALKADYTLYDQAEERSRLLWFYRELEMVLEAGLLLSQQNLRH
jgi:hypothetical protein